MKLSVRRWPPVSVLLAALVVASCIRPEPSRYADGMRRGVPENEGVHSHGIIDFLEEVDNHGLELHSFMFLRHNRVIAEGWWHPYKPSAPHIMHSVSKTFTATAIGFAVKEKLLSVDDRVISFFPDELPPAVSPHLEKLSIKHLLTMTAGHEAAPEFHMSDSNWVRSFLATPVANEPGTVFQYSSYASYMLSAILQKASGLTAMEYLAPRLFEPLGVDGVKWEEGAQGVSAGGWGMHIRTADMAKLGQFYLQKGKWNKKRLLPEEWIKEATAVRIYQVDNPTFEQEMYDDWAQGYAYQLWRSTHNAYRADGANGQFIIVMPDQDAVIAITARVSDTRKVLSLLWEHLFPSIMDRPLRENPRANDMLVSKLASLRIPDPVRTWEELFIFKEIRRSFAMEPNERQITDVTFVFNEEGGCLFSFTDDKGTASFVFGQDRWMYGETERLSPYFLNPRRNPAGAPPFAVAGYSGWPANSQLELRLLYLDDTTSETYSCSFGRLEADVEISISNSERPREAPLVLKGKRQQ
ncbi:MAG: beta-lactamase family protein [Tannerellaceae bacterium]|jgi:CubicO group peptidase (beta-lactamase class C family)|nr:beta-lactamase family protein [Tannerellaceae bacterium]